LLNLRTPPPRAAFASANGFGTCSFANACGDRMTREQCQELMRNVKANKHRAARDAMAQYRKEGEEEHHG
jgi:hypothetical protein